MVDNGLLVGGYQLTNTIDSNGISLGPTAGNWLRWCVAQALRTVFHSAIISKYPVTLMIMMMMMTTRGRISVWFPEYLTACSGWWAHWMPISRSCEMIMVKECHTHGELTAGMTFSQSPYRFAFTCHTCHVEKAGVFHGDWTADWPAPGAEQRPLWGPKPVMPFLFPPWNSKMPWKGPLKIYLINHKQKNDC